MNTVISAWQLSALDAVPERLVRFGRFRRSITISIIEDDSGWLIEARCGRRLVERYRVSTGRRELAAALDRGCLHATGALLESIS